MEGKSSIKELISKFKEIKNVEWIVVILIIAIIISIYASTLNNTSDTRQAEEQKENDTGLHWVDEDNSPQARDERKLEEILSAIKGAGEVQVMVTYTSGKEIVPAMNTIESTTTTEEEDNDGGVRNINQTDINSQPSTFNDSEGSKPIILKEVEPEVKGIIIISEGAEDIRVKLELMKAVQIALGVKPNQVEVFPMEKSN